MSFKSKGIRKTAIFGGILIIIAIIGVYIFNINSNPVNTLEIQPNNNIVQENIYDVPSKGSTPTQQDQQINIKSEDKQGVEQSQTNGNQVSKPSVSLNTNQIQTTKPAVSTIDGIRILKSEITSTAKFYPYQLGSTYMEVIAVKATDGSIRTSLNTCQVCYDSGRGYYKQSGDYLVCQNCGNRFYIDQVELVKGGCNPVPILEENKKDVGDSIIIPKEYLETQKEYFSRWKR